MDGFSFSQREPVAGEEEFLHAHRALAERAARSWLSRGRSRMVLHYREEARADALISLLRYYRQDPVRAREAAPSLLNTIAQTGVRDGMRNRFGESRWLDGLPDEARLTSLEAMTELDPAQGELGYLRVEEELIARQVRELDLSRVAGLTEKQREVFERTVLGEQEGRQLARERGVREEGISQLKRRAITLVNAELGLDPPDRRTFLLTEQKLARRARDREKKRRASEKKRQGAEVTAGNLKAEKSCPSDR